MKWRTLVSAVFPSLALLIACKPGGDPSDHISMDETASQLRDRFNSDVGRVRVLMLAAPT
jgi:hypothetical protein